MPGRFSATAASDHAAVGAQASDHAAVGASQVSPGGVYAVAVHREADGSIKLTRDEAYVCRAALFAVDHLAAEDPAWHEAEIRVVTGATLDEMHQLRVALDDTQRPDETLRQAEALQSHLAIVAGWTNSQLESNRGQHRLAGVIAIADELGVSVPARLRTALKRQS